MEGWIWALRWGWLGLKFRALGCGFGRRGPYVWVKHFVYGVVGIGHRVEGLGNGFGMLGFGDRVLV